MFILCWLTWQVWPQKAATCIRSAKMHPNNACVPLYVPHITFTAANSYEKTPCFWQNLLRGFQNSINMLNLIFQQILYPSAAKTNFVIFVILFQPGWESFKIAYNFKSFKNSNLQLFRKLRMLNCELKLNIRCLKNLSIFTMIKKSIAY